MEIKINKEVRSYTESIFFGLSPRQFIYSILACLVAVIIYFLTIDTLGMETTSWLCMLGAAPFASIGFITYQSMTMEKIVLEFFKSLLLKRTELIDKPINLYYELAKPIIEKSKKEELKRNAKKFIKIQKTEQGKD
ncbi:MAG: PrgI family protein [Holdemanella porci]|nr:PrgI family protein [Holdemanella porci]